MEEVLRLVVSNDSYITTLKLKGREDSRIAMSALADIAKKSGYSISRTKTPLMLDVLNRKMGIFSEQVGVIAYDSSIKDCKMMLGNTDAQKVIEFLKNNSSFKLG